MTNERPFRFVSTVDSADTNPVITGVTLALPPKGVVILTLTNTDGSFDYEAGFTNPTLLDKGFAAGSYAFTIKSVNDGTNKGTLVFPKAAIYPSVPRLGNFLDVQEVEPEQPLNLSWGAFTNGTTNDFIMVEVSETNGSSVASTPALLEVDALNGTNLIVQIPADTLDYSNVYEGRLMFLKRTTTNTVSYPGATGVAGYFRQTKFPITTLAPPPSHGRIQFSARNFSVAENAGSADITVTRSGTEGDASVDIFTTDGTATDGLDYTVLSTSIQFHDGDTMATIPISILDDYLLEGNETVNVWLANATGGAELGNRTNALLTIMDNEIAAAGKLQIIPVTYSLSETNKAVNLTVLRTGNKIGTVSATFATADGSALGGSDYVATNGTVIFTNGQTSKVISVPLLNDTLQESNKTFTVNLLTTTGGAAYGTNLTSTVTILNDDIGGVINFTRAGISANENSTNFVVNVSRKGGKASDVTVDYSTTGGTATADVDYVSTYGTLTFGAGETNKTILVPIINDTLPEGLENFTLTLANVTGGATLGTTNVCTLTIVDDESSISLGTPAITVSEAGTNVSITLTRSGATNTAVFVDFATTDITATNGVHYTGTNGTFSFPAGGATSKTFLIPIKDNTVVDNSRTFKFTLSNPTGGVQLGSITNTTVTITNNDFAGAIQFASATFSGTEGSNAVITLTRTGGLASGIYIYVSMVGGTATTGVDYTNMSGYVLFNAGETNKTILVPLITDLLNESTETVNLFFGTIIGGASIGAQSTATLNILNKPDANAVPLTGPLFMTWKIGSTTITANIVAGATDTHGGNLIVTGTSSSTSDFKQLIMDVGPSVPGTLHLTDAGLNGTCTYTVSPFSGVGAKNWDLAGSSSNNGSTGTFIYDAIDHTLKLASGRFTLHLFQITGVGAGTFIDMVGSFRIQLQ